MNLEGGRTNYGLEIEITEFAYWLNFFTGDKYIAIVEPSESNKNSDKAFTIALKLSGCDINIYTKTNDQEFRQSNLTTLRPNFLLFQKPFTNQIKDVVSEAMRNINKYASLINDFTIEDPNNNEANIIERLSREE